MSVKTIVEQVDVGPVRLELERPREPDTLLDEEAFVRDEFMPYWAEVWPSGIALARHIGTLELGGQRVLELGCGLGLPALAAALSGAGVVALDWADDAIDLLRRNAARNGAGIEGLTLDWRDADALARRTFDLVLAADVLYEERNAGPLLRVLPTVLAAGGEALVADPGRRHAAAFLAAAEQDGWLLETLRDPLLPHGGIHRLRRP